MTEIEEVLLRLFKKHNQDSLQKGNQTVEIQVDWEEVAGFLRPNVIFRVKDNETFTIVRYG